MNTPRRGNKYFLYILIYQLLLSFSLPVLETMIGTGLFASPLAIVPLHVFLFILPFIAYLFLTSQKITDVLPLRKINFTNIGLIVLMCITIQPLMMVFSGLSSLLFPNNVSIVMSELYTMPLPIVVLVTSLTPAITEEITLRGIVLTNYSQIPVKKAAFLNGILFGIIHLDLQQFLYAFLLGFMFVYFVYYTKSLFASVTAHFTINFIQTSLAYFSFKLLENPDIAAAVESAEQTSGSDTMAVVISLAVIALIFTPVCLVLFRAFVYYNKQRMVVEAFTPTELQQEEPDNAHTESSTEIPEETNTENNPNPQSNRRIFDFNLLFIFLIFILFTIFSFIMQIN